MYWAIGRVYYTFSQVYDKKLGEYLICDISTLTVNYPSCQPQLGVGEKPPETDGELKAKLTYKLGSNMRPFGDCRSPLSHNEHIRVWSMYIARMRPDQSL